MSSRLLRRMVPAYRLAVVILRPPLMTLTRRDWGGVVNLPRDRGFVAVVNHISHVDPLVFAHFLYDNGADPYFLAKISMFEIPFAGRIIKGANQIPVYRETGRAGDAYRAAVAAVREGRCVAVYPEGSITREPDGWPMRGKTGAARIALATRCPVIPVAQWGAQEIMPAYGRSMALFPRKMIRFRAGPEVDLTDLYDIHQSREVLADATERIMTAITTELEVIRGQQAPPGRYDPRVHGQAVTGRPDPLPPSKETT